MLWGNTFRNIVQAAGVKTAVAGKWQMSLLKENRITRTSSFDAPQPVGVARGAATVTDDSERAVAARGSRSVRPGSVHGIPD